MIMLELLVLGVCAVLLFARLWSVLGQKPEKSGPLPNNVVRLRRDQVNVQKEAERRVDFFPGFDESTFLEGAERAFPLILKAYHGRDEVLLKKFMTPDLASSALSGGEAAPSSFPENVCLLSAVVVHKTIDEGTARILVHFTSQQVFESKPRTIEDFWLFEKKILDSDPTWFLAGVGQNRP